MKRSLSLFGPFVAFFAPLGALLAQENADTASKIAAAAGSAPAVTVTLWQLVASGGWAMAPLAAMSVLTVMFIIGYAFTLRREAVVSSHFMSTAEVLIKKRDYAGLLGIANRHPEAIARVTYQMLDFAVKNPAASFEVLREIAQTEGAAQASNLQHRITYLADIAVLSPMVGLLGTVFGIIRSFGEMANAANQSRTGLLAGGVSEALVATGTGLIVGIISMGFYGVYRNRVQSLISALEGASAQLLGLLAINFDKREEKRDGAAPRKDRDPAQNAAPSGNAPRRAAVALDDEF